MDPTITISVIAGCAALAAGVMTTILSKLKVDTDYLKVLEDKRLHHQQWSSRKAEVRATGKALQKSIEYSGRAARRVRLLVVISGMYFLTVAVSLLTVDSSRDGWYRRSMELAALGLGILLIALVVSAFLMAYKAIRDRQDQLKVEVESLHKELARH